MSGGESWALRLKNRTLTPPLWTTLMKTVCIFIQPFSRSRHPILSFLTREKPQVPLEQGCCRRAKSLNSPSQRSRVVSKERHFQAEHENITFIAKTLLTSWEIECQSLTKMVFKMFQNWKLWHSISQLVSNVLAINVIFSCSAWKWRSFDTTLDLWDGELSDLARRQQPCSKGCWGFSRVKKDKIGCRDLENGWMKMQTLFTKVVGNGGVSVRFFSLRAQFSPPDILVDTL